MAPQKEKNKLGPAILVAFLSLIISGLIANYLFPDSRFSELQKLEIAKKINNYSYILNYYSHKLQNDFTNIEINQHYIDIYLATNTDSAEHLFNNYVELAKDNDSMTSDLGHYCLGYYFSNLGNCIEANKYYSMVKNTNMKYLNNSIGNCMKRLGHLSLAESI